jgi:hypothetical protein
MATFTKLHLSSSVGGQPIYVSDSSDPGTAIHTTGTSASDIDEIWLYANNVSVSDVELTVEYGGVVDGINHIVISIPSKSGLVLVVPGLTLSGDGTSSRVVGAFAASANAINITGYVNRIS